MALVLAYAFLASGAAAQEADVRRAIRETLGAWSSGDFDRFASYYHPQARGFFLDGGVLLEGVDAEALKAGYEAGVRASFTLADLDVRLFGDVAVSEAYLEGALTLPGGAVRPGTWRYSETRIREGSTWKVVQFHFSPMTAAAR